jgi:hypothetical protein
MRNACIYQMSPSDVLRNVSFTSVINNQFTSTGCHQMSPDVTATFLFLVDSRCFADVTATAPTVLTTLPPLFTPAASL